LALQFQNLLERAMLALRGQKAVSIGDDHRIHDNRPDGSPDEPASMKQEMDASSSWLQDSLAARLCLAAGR
jgi:hypothetical protein